MTTQTVVPNILEEKSPLIHFRQDNSHVGLPGCEEIMIFCPASNGLFPEKVINFSKRVHQQGYDVRLYTTDSLENAMVEREIISARDAGEIVLALDENSCDFNTDLHFLEALFLANAA